MTYQIEITDFAYFDLDDIYAYLSNISNARPQNTITQILDVIDTLNEKNNLESRVHLCLKGYWKLIFTAIKFSKRKVTNLNHIAPIFDRTCRMVKLSYKCHFFIKNFFCYQIN